MTFIVWIAVMIAATSSDCTTDEDCNLNGICTTTTQTTTTTSCRCDPWWSGPQCSTLNLGAAKPNGGYRTTSGAKFSSWGASATRATDGTYHLFAVRIEGGKKVGDGVVFSK